MSDPEAIVRDLAHLSPIMDSDLGDYCAMCGKVAGADVDLIEPEVHELHCVWRRTRASFPGPSG